MIRTVVRSLTTFFGAISRLIAYLAVGLALPVAALSVTFLWPPVVGSLGVNSLLTGSVTEIVSDVEAATPLSATLLLVSLVGLIGLYLLGNRAGDYLVEIGQPAANTADTGGSETRSMPADYRRKLSNLSYLVAGFFGLVATVTFIEPTVIPLSLITGIGLGAIQFVFVGFTAGYAITGYGARRGWAESVIVGAVLYLVNLLAALSNLSPLGMLIGGYGFYYTVRGIGGTTFVLLDVDPSAVALALERRFPGLHRVLTNSGDTVTAVRTAEASTTGESPESSAPEAVTDSQAGEGGR